MIIMLMLLILSLIVIIITAIYLNYKKKNTNISAGKNLNQEKQEKKGKKQLKDFLQIEIKDNIICLGNRYSAVIKLGNIDYNMLSKDEQDTVESILIQTALSIDYPIQFFSTTEYIDTSKAIETIKQNESKNEKIEEYKNYLIAYLENLMENRKITIIKNYAIISYDGIYENAVEELNRKCLSFKGNLLRAKIICEILSKNEIYNLIYRELNKNSVQNISHLMEGGGKLYVEKK